MKIEELIENKIKCLVEEFVKASEEDKHEIAQLISYWEHLKDRIAKDKLDDETMRRVKKQLGAR